MDKATRFKYVKLTLGNEDLGVHYDYRHFLKSECIAAHSKYLCLSNTGSLPAFFKMELFDTNACAFQFHDGPYKDQWMHNSGGYLYVQSQRDSLKGDFNANESSVKLWTTQNGTKYWFKKGNKYKNDHFGDFFYVVTTTNESEALTFGIQDVSESMGIRQPKAEASKKAYFFKNGQYIPYNITAKKAEGGYPKPMKGNWPGLEGFNGRIDAIVELDDGKIAFFSGPNYITYDTINAQFASQPKPIKGGDWPGLEPFADGIDAAVNTGKGKIYFFKGSQYITYDSVAGRAFKGFPAPIKGNWLAIGDFTSGIDAAVKMEEDKLHLFKGPHFYVYDLVRDQADTGKLLPIKGNLPGLEAFADGIDGASVL